MLSHSSSLFTWKGTHEVMLEVCGTAARVERHLNLGNVGLSLGLRAATNKLRGWDEATMFSFWPLDVLPCISPQAKFTSAAAK
jgi:hypothetical protein